MDDLLHSETLRGKARAEVGALLGPPTQTDKWNDWDLVYWLGPERSYIAVDSEWLIVRFDNDRVSDARLVRD
ncbi:hypothetical protein [Brevundimonas sp.]|uniref:hypothetical protein n=1 Tax=Brevundimonas sp. TaxID=1871086 RepID=UPI003D0F534D